MMYQFWLLLFGLCSLGTKNQILKIFEKIDFFKIAPLAFTGDPYDLWPK